MKSITGNERNQFIFKSQLSKAATLVNANLVVAEKKQCSNDVYYLEL